ncbi:MAG: Carbamate kinase [Methanothrix sp.]|nr:MAG: Carbamate kinase [Methanothrix sp.]
MVAFGGNALLPDPLEPSSQASRARALAGALRLVNPAGEGMVLVHGNGPQVGMILLRIEATRDRIPPEPLDVLVAETQGSIGYLLARAIRSSPVPGSQEVAAVMTQVVVDSSDPAFSNPTKPVGPYYTDEEANRLEEVCGWDMAAGPRGWRRTVPSPRPREVVEIRTIREATASGTIVIAGGGGGVPVIRGGDGELIGAEAVVDKDLTASLIAVCLEARRLVILTEVDAVYRDFGGENPEPVHILRHDEASGLLESGELPPGSMGPKVEGALFFSISTGREALITDLDHLDEALNHRAGTWVLP